MNHFLKRMCCLLLSAACVFTAGILPASAGDDPDDAPVLLQEAKWIWTADTENNVWVTLSKTFTLDTVPKEAVAEIAVENKYQLFVNGERAVYDGGLKRGYNATEGYFDRVDLAPYLREGENEIFVKAWFWGVKEQSYSNVPLDAAGFLFAMDAGGILIASDGSWMAARDLAYKDDSAEAYSVPQPNYRLPEYNIYYVAADAVEPDFQPAQVRGSYGDAPRNALHCRPIPMIKAYGLTDFENTAEYEEYTTSAQEAITMKTPYNAQLAPYLEISSDKEAVITITTDNTEHLENSVRVTYVADGSGRQSFEAPAWFSGQFITYDIPEGITIHRLAYRESGYDTAIDGSFSMGNDFYDTLWQMGARTQMLCIRDNYMDCPDRERAQWTGDAATQMRVMTYCLNTNTYTLYKKMMRQKINWVVSGGKGGLNDLLPTVVPIYNEFYELPAQEMAGIISAWDYYLYTGDSELIAAVYPAFRNYLNLWKTSGSGLVKHKTGQGLPDWQDTGTNRVDTKVQENALYYWALSSVRNMAALLGEDTAKIDERLAGIREGYQTLWVDGVGYTTSDTADDRANAFAVLSGLAPTEHYETIHKVLTTTQKSSIYSEAYVLQALCEMGYVSDALDRMQDRYGNMVQRNLETGMSTLWEYFEEGMGTFNHAWAASPVYILSAYVSGIRPASEGFSSYVIAPDFSHSDTVSASMETILGTISVEAQNDGTMHLVLPAGGTANVRVSANTGSTVFVNGTAVTGTEEDGFIWITITDSGSFDLSVQ